jgi:hypothetical protein
MGFFKRFTAPKAKIELKPDEAVYDYKQKMKGRIIVDPQEDIPTDGLRVEFEAHQKIKWRKGFTSYSSSSSFETQKIPVSGPLSLQNGQHFEQPFEVQIPFYSRPDPYTEIELKAKGVAIVKDRPDLTHELKLGINFPYVIECSSQFGGCGFVTEPSEMSVSVCPKCGRNLEELWARKMKLRAAEAHARAQGARGHHRQVGRMR